MYQAGPSFSGRGILPVPGIDGGPRRRRLPEMAPRRSRMERAVPAPAEAWHWWRSVFLGQGGRDSGIATVRRTLLLADEALADGVQAGVATGHRVVVAPDPDRGHVDGETVGVAGDGWPGGAGGSALAHHVLGDAVVVVARASAGVAEAGVHAGGPGHRALQAVGRIGRSHVDRGAGAAGIVGIGG